jgi:threonine dehydrogenase-like Zn-dependent dehydrogenase
VRAFVLDDNPPRLVADWPDPEPNPGWARVRPLIAGICNTDLELARGYMGFKGVLGHEFVGEALDGAFAGKRVVGGINFGCGDCPSCLSGMARHCPTRTVLGILGADGVFAESFAIPERNLLEVPATVGDEEAVFTEPLAAACQILDQIGDERGRACVLGAGKLGTLVAQVLSVAGFETDLVGRHLQGLGFVDASGVRRVGERAEGSGYDLVVEATGSEEGLALALSLVRPRGHLVLKTTVAARHAVDLAPVVINEIHIIGSRCGRFEPALALLAERRVDVRPLISARFALANIEEAFGAAAGRGVRKVLVRHD